MKKTIYLLVVALTIWRTSATAQENVPENVKMAFQKKYPNIKDATWKKEEGVYEAKFTENGKRMAIHMDKSGTEKAKEYYIEESELPQPAQDYLKKNYPGTTFEEISRVVKSNGKVHYEAETKGKEISFDEKGNFIKVEKEKDEY